MQAVATLQNAWILAGPATSMDRHGVYKACGAPCVPACLIQGTRQITGHATGLDFPQTAPKLTGTYAYGGAIAGHFGHMLLETFARLSVFDAFEGMIIFSQLPQSQLPMFWHLVDAMNLPRARILVINAPTRIADLRVAPAGFRIRHDISSSFTDTYAARGLSMARRLRVVENSSDTLAYLSRSQTKQTGRYVFGETLIEEILRRQGADIIHPQRFSFDEQVAIWLTRRRLGGFAGSAFHPMLLTTTPKTLTYLTTGTINANFKMIEKHKTNDARYVAVSTNPAGLATQDKGPFLLSRQGVVDACHALGFDADLSDVPKADYAACVKAYHDRGA